MPSQTTTEEETDTQEELQHDSRTDSLKARIKNHNGETPLEIISDKYHYLDTQEVTEITDVIAENPKINAINVEVNVSENGAERIVNSFLKNEYANELRLNVFNRVENPSQWRVIRTQTYLKKIVASHNDIQQWREQKALLILSAIGNSNNRRKRQRHGNESSKIDLPALPDAVLRDKLAPMLTSKKKRLIVD